jgi:hypothetical protein
VTLNPQSSKFKRNEPEEPQAMLLFGEDYPSEILDYESTQLYFLSATPGEDLIADILSNELEQTFLPNMKSVEFHTIIKKWIPKKIKNFVKKWVAQN